MSLLIPHPSYECRHHQAKDLLTKFYEEHNPKKLSQVMMMMVVVVVVVYLHVITFSY